MLGAIHASDVGFILAVIAGLLAIGAIFFVEKAIYFLAVGLGLLALAVLLQL